MSPNRLPRVSGFAYRGMFRYFLTVSTDRARPVFNDFAAGREVIEQLLIVAAQSEFSVLAYCAMPDHLHALVEGTSESADFREFVRRWKQRTGYDWKQRHGQRLWKAGYHDYVLRSGDRSDNFVRYIWGNPVEAGLASSVRDYELSGPREQPQRPAPTADDRRTGASLDAPSF
jgi:putative transposase